GEKRTRAWKPLLTSCTHLARHASTHASRRMRRSLDLDQRSNCGRAIIDLVQRRADHAASAHRCRRALVTRFLSLRRSAVLDSEGMTILQAERCAGLRYYRAAASRGRVPQASESGIATRTVPGNSFRCRAATLFGTM